MSLTCFRASGAGSPSAPARHGGRLPARSRVAANDVIPRWSHDSRVGAFLGMLHSSSEYRTSHKHAKQSSFLSTISPRKIHHTEINSKLSYLLLPVVIQDSHSLYSNWLSLIKGMVLWGHFPPFYLSMKQEKKGGFCSLLHLNPLCQVPNKRIITLPLLWSSKPLEIDCSNGKVGRIS